MSPPLAKLDPRVTRIAEVMVEEIGRLADEVALRRQPSKADIAIMEACRKVAIASDKLIAARFAGQAEAGARRGLDQAAKRLASVMRAAGRLDRGRG